jgi:hypothetical protein
MFILEMFILEMFILEMFILEMFILEMFIMQSDVSSEVMILPLKLHVPFFIVFYLPLGQ